MAKAFIHDQTSNVLEKKTNARLTVNCQSGSYVELMLGSEVVKTAVADSSNKVIFFGLVQGEYTVNINDGESTVQHNIDIITDHEVTIDPIATTINVTYPAGSICEIKLDDYNCHTAPDTSGAWKCVVPLKGAWTVSCAKDDRVESKTVNVTDTNQFFNVALEFFEATAVVTYPVGFACTCTDGESTIKAPDTSGSWTCAIPSRGEWSFTCSKDVRSRTETKIFDTDRQTVDVNLGDFIGAVYVTYDAGYECTVSSGDEIHMTTNTSGGWICSVYSAGEYTATCMNGVIDKTKAVIVPTEEPCSVTVDLRGFKALVRAIVPDGYVCQIVDSSNAVVAGAVGSPGITNYSLYVYTIGNYTVRSFLNGSMSTTIRTVGINVTSDWEVVTVNFSDFQATIDITYPENSVCSCSDGVTTLYAPDITGRWIATVPTTGTWTVTASYAEQTGTKTVDITAYGQNESVTVKFFAATIDVTYPVGAACTCTDGITTINAPDTTGRWNLIVPRAGEWLIRAVDGDRNASDSVVITMDGGYRATTLEFFVAYINVTYPSGSNKVQLWYINSYGTKIEVGTHVIGTNDINYTFEVPQAGTYEAGVYRVSPYVGIESSAKDYTSTTIMVDAHKQFVNVALKYDSLPKFTYTGTYRYTDDLGNEITESDGDWNIQFLTSGALKFTKLNGAADGIDVFVLGGGGNGGDGSISDGSAGAFYDDGTFNAGGGGGGGCRENSFGQIIDVGTTYPIIIGGAGGSSSGFGTSASGGGAGGNGSTSAGGAGSGGTGGSRGGRGAHYYVVDSDPGYVGEDGEDGEDGEGAFLDNSTYLFGAGGGGGGTSRSLRADSGGGGKSGAGEGIRGGWDDLNRYHINGDPNSGSGGGGGASVVLAKYDELPGIITGGSGGSGIVIIRNKR